MFDPTQDPHYQKIMARDLARRKADEAERRQREIEDENRKHQRNADIRGWITLAVSILSLFLSAFSIIWQVSLH